MQLSFFCGTAHFWPDRWVGRWGRRILPGISRMPTPPQEGDLLLQEHRAAAHGAAAEAAEGRAAACGKGGTDAGRAGARPNAKGEHTWTCVIRLLRLPAALEERADEQDDHKDDEVEQHLDMVGADGGVYHEQGAQGGQDGHDLAAEGGQIIALH